MKIWIVIPMHNFKELTDQCIEACRKNAGIDHDILVVDDFSDEPYVNEDVAVVRLDKNYGFTRAVNEGLRMLELAYDFVCLLNNDTIPEPDFLKNMVATAQDERVGIVGAGRISSRDPYTVGMWGEDLTTGLVAASYTDLEEPCLSIWIPFCCVLLSKHMVQTIGLLDERMINHCSDNDYCIRALLMGYAVVFEPRAKVFHYQSKTIESKGLLPYDDQRTFVKKWCGPAINEIFDKMPFNAEMHKYAVVGFKYETREPDLSSRIIRV